MMDVPLYSSRLVTGVDGIDGQGDKVHEHRRGEGVRVAAQAVQGIQA